MSGNVWSSSGVSAGIDVTLAWVAELWGVATARELAGGMEYEWHEDADWDVSLLFSLIHYLSRDSKLGIGGCEIGLLTCGLE